MVAGGGSTKKPRGKMTPYACFVKVIRAEHKKKHPNEHIVFAEFSKKCAEKWATMDLEKKKRFHELSIKDKERYEFEMSTYIPPPGEEIPKTGKGSRRPKQKKDPNAPKKALCGFIFFCNDERPNVKAENPEMKIGEIAKILGQMWKVCPKKDYYEKMAVADKKRYEDALRVYKSGLGRAPQAAPQAAASAAYGAAGVAYGQEDDMESDESGSGSDEEEYE